MREEHPEIYCGETSLFREVFLFCMIPPWPKIEKT
jgi:hypothetical protein